MSRVPYASGVGNLMYAMVCTSLMYAMVCTRPDLAHALSVVSRFMGDPGKEHCQAVKRISVLFMEMILSVSHWVF